MTSDCSRPVNGGASVVASGVAAAVVAVVLAGAVVGAEDAVPDEQADSRATTVTATPAPMMSPVRRFGGAGWLASGLRGSADPGEDWSGWLIGSPGGWSTMALDRGRAARGWQTPVPKDRSGLF